ncbi:MAG: YggS family pyridoxal phosphate enzyme [Actinomycetes bacterium]
MTGDSVSPPPELVDQISERADALRRRWTELTDRSVRLICVTKGHGPEVAAAAVAAGLTDLGENYAQELADKAASFEGAGIAARWHFIGQLQRNKIRIIAPHVHWWHTVDRPALAVSLGERVPGATVLVQVDVANLPGRGGCSFAEVPALVAEARGAGLDVVGLMGVAPPGSPEDARPGFRRLVALADDLGLPERSIGMSGDADVAVSEGATVVRIGSALVGPRPARTRRNAAGD